MFLNSQWVFGVDPQIVINWPLTGKPDPLKVHRECSNHIGLNLLKTVWGIKGKWLAMMVFFRASSNANTTCDPTPDREKQLRTAFRQSESSDEDTSVDAARVDATHIDGAVL